MAEDGSWTLIESDPGVFTELIQQMGVKGVQVDELHSLEEEDLRALGPVYGLIFLFKWRAEKDDRQIDYHAMEKVWFANQVITNACATQAIISVLFNRPELQLGDELSNLRSFSMDFPPQMKGLTIGNSDMVRAAHNSFRTPESFVSDDAGDGHDNEDVFHFISYVPVEGALYELDGLKEGPIKLADCTEENWLFVAAPSIQKRIEQYAMNEIRFNLLAVVRNRCQALEEQLQGQIALKEQLESSNFTEDSSTMDIDGPRNSSLDKDTRIIQVESEIMRLKDSIVAEKEKQKAWKDENIRRKHNYIPFLFNFLKVLAEKDQLKGLIQRAKEEQDKKDMNK